ncbi:MarR family winged helix-turn-helix transcriptional regulator [Paenibacillus chibensis]|uniref:MarR family winged helix-turn-helix transcriptional regulator n=1 Tax=Paenibacillus chibensis TaxID=59846 RepID=UPI000FDBDFBE|nr:MarR family transcriptional regulator [Paenibacillus chibensis]MEC0370261.1 MarR family transcriptional regulator [Paenibacillus chibensis]
MDKYIESADLFEEIMMRGAEQMVKWIDHPLWKEYSPQQLRLMKLVEQLGSMTAGQLADMTQVHKSAISNRLKKLTEKGLVKVERKENDNRISVITITPAGKATVDEAYTVLYGHIRNMVQATLEEEEVDQFIRSLRKLKQMLEKGQPPGSNDRGNG